MPKNNDLSPLALALIGKGQVAAFRPVPCPTPWRGALTVSRPPFSEAGIEENKRLYPHLFRG